MQIDDPDMFVMREGRSRALGRVIQSFSVDDLCLASSFGLASFQRCLNEFQSHPIEQHQEKRCVERVILLKRLLLRCVDALSAAPRKAKRSPEDELGPLSQISLNRQQSEGSALLLNSSLDESICELLQSAALLDDGLAVPSIISHSATVSISSVPAVPQQFPPDSSSAAATPAIQPRNQPSPLVVASHPRLWPTPLEDAPRHESNKSAGGGLTSLFGADDDDDEF